MMEMSRYNIPLADGEQTREVLTLLSEVFGAEEAQVEKPTLTGEEGEHNLDILYTAREGGELLGTVHVTIPRTMGSIGVISGVCTAFSARRRGIGQALLERCVSDFDAAGGEAMFLGTGNHVAAKLYASFGFSFLPGSNVMARVNGGDHADFAERYFSEASGKLEIVEGSPAFRCLLVPLVLRRGGGLILDCNAELFSSMYVTQRSCAGLYPRYAGISAKGGLFAGAVSPAGALCAIASILPMQDGMRMDFFAHPDAEHCLPSLVEWCEAHSADYAPAYALASDEDAAKRRLLESLGYREAGRQAYKSGPASIDCATMRYNI